jgi:tetratricopeptide (TPR) repeat protein
MEAMKRTLFLIGLMAALALTASAEEKPHDHNAPMELAPRDFDFIVDKRGMDYRGGLADEVGENVQIRKGGAQVTVPKADIVRWVKRAKMDQVYKELSDSIPKGDDGCRMKLARLCIGRKMTAEAAAELAIAVREGSQKPEVFQLLVELLLKQGKVPEARDVLNRANALFQPGVAWNMLRLQIDEAGGQAAAVVYQNLKPLVNANPESAPLWRFFGKVCLRLGRAKEAQVAFQKAIDLDKAVVEAHVGLGDALVAGADYAAAAAPYAKAQELDKDSEDARIGMAAAQFYQGARTEARRTIGNLLVIHPESPRGHELLGFILLIDGKREDADAKFDRALKSARADPRLPLLLGYRDESDPTAGADGLKRAIEQYRAAVRRDPEDGLSQTVLADALARSDDLAGAEDAYQKASECSPDYARTFLALGAVRMAAKKPEAAEQAFRRAAELDKSSAEALAGCGAALLAKLPPDVSGAERLFKQALDKDPACVTALCGKAWVLNHDAAGPDAAREAAECLRKALLIDPANAFAIEAIKIIHESLKEELQLHTFSDPAAFNQFWRANTANSRLKVDVKIDKGRLLFTSAGTQPSDGLADMVVQVLNGKPFVRFEAILSMDAAGGAGGGVVLRTDNSSAYLYFGKTAGGRLAWQSKDSHGTGVLNEIGEWPADGRVRLAIERKNIEKGEFKLTVNGEVKAEPRVDSLATGAKGGIWAGVYAGVAGGTEVKVSALMAALVLEPAEEK